MTGGGPVRVEGVGRASIQGDVRFTEVLERMGARITMGENWIEASAGEDAAKRGKLKALDADLNHIPDAAMTAAVAALFADGTSTLRNIGSWRVKETDRIAAMATELRKLGATVEEGADYLRITPPARPHAARVDRHLRRSPHGHVLFARCAGRRAGAHQRSRMRAQNFSRVLQGARLDFGGAPVTTPAARDRHRRAVRFRQGHGGAQGRARAGFHFLDSGALYRLVALAAMERGLDLENTLDLAHIARNLNVKFEDDAIWLDGRDVTDAIRDERVSGAASKVAALEPVRRGAARAPARLPAAARAWWPTAATWARWFSPTRRSKSSSRRTRPSVPAGAINS